jgi:nucleoside-diphosphate-sugar epimerase
MATAFVTGATGVLGRGTVHRLLEDGYAVRALARNAERASVISALGAEPVVADIFDLDAMTRAMSGTDIALHLATRIPPVMQARRASAWAENTRLRAVGTRVLVDAALATGVGHFVAESITFIYRDGGSEWLDERSPVDATVGLQSVVTLEDEVARFAAGGGGNGGVGIALRFGGFYGSDARGTDEYLAAAARRIAPVLGPAGGYVSSIHTRDAADAVVASLAAPTGVYNVVDDVPLTRRDYADAFAHAFGLRRLRIIPPSVVRIVGGGAARPLLRSQRVRNAAVRDATGWTPTIPSAVEGWAAVAATRKEDSRA